MRGVDLLTLAIGATLIACIAGIVWLLGDDDWREALSEPFGDVIDLPDGAKSAAPGGMLGRGEAGGRPDAANTLTNADARTRHGEVL